MAIAVTRSVDRMEYIHPEAFFAAGTIGDPSLSEEINEIITTSVHKQLIFHGIARSVHLDSVLREGVVPKSPEGPFVQNSFWTYGTRLFASTSGSRFTSYDTSFFHYAHSSGGDEKVRQFNLVVTDLSALESSGLTYQGSFRKYSGDVCINDVVPMDICQVVHAEVDTDNAAHHSTLSLIALRSLAAVVERY